MQQDIAGKGTTHLDNKLDYDKSHDVTFSSHTHNDEEIKIMRFIKFAHIGMTTHRISVCSTLINLRIHYLPVQH